MKIQTIPHPILRAQAAPITEVTPELLSFVTQLGDTLRTNKRPGVGLAAPQVAKSWRIFCTYLGKADGSPDRKKLEIFINPRIEKTFGQPTFGEDETNPVLEGCLSIPSLYGPVPRFARIKLVYDQVIGSQLVATSREFEDFPARVVQHELDHLDGKLFIDYSIAFELPLYQENARTEKLEPLQVIDVVESMAEPERVLP